MHQRKVEKVIESSEGSAGLLHKITNLTMWRGGVQDARLLDRCEGEETRNGQRHWQSDEEIQNKQNKPWRNDELKECEEALPRLKEGDLDKASILYKARTGVGCDGFHPKVLFGFDKKKREEKLSSSWKKWNKVVYGRNKPARRRSS